MCGLGGTNSTNKVPVSIGRVPTIYPPRRVKYPFVGCGSPSRAFSEGGEWRRIGWLYWCCHRELLVSVVSDCVLLLIRCAPTRCRKKEFLGEFEEE